MKKEVTFEEAMKRLEEMKKHGVRLFPNLTVEEKRQLLMIDDEPAVSAEKKTQTRK